MVFTNKALKGFKKALKRLNKALKRLNKALKRAANRNITKQSFPSLK